MVNLFDKISDKNQEKLLKLLEANTFTFKELAEYLAVDRSAMTRELKNLKEAGFIDIKSKKITLLY